MNSATQEIQALLVASRALLGDGELDAANLQQWIAERETVFARLQGQDLASAAAVSGDLAALIRELIVLDGEIRARVSEYQAGIGVQIAATQRVRRVLSSSRPGSATRLRVSA